MSAFAALTSRSVVLRQSNIDTDQIIPARFLSTTERAGLGKHAFNDWRWQADGAPNPDFAFNQPGNAGRSILLAGRNFGCGSSREHAPWALADYGFRAVISTEIADIFTSNALKNGVLPIVVDQSVWDDLASQPDQPVTIDLENNEIRRGNAHPVPFRVEAFARRCLLDGVDALGWLQSKLPDIEAFEASRESETV